MKENGYMCFQKVSIYSVANTDFVHVRVGKVNQNGSVGRLKWGEFSQTFQFLQQNNIRWLVEKVNQYGLHVLLYVMVLQELDVWFPSLQNFRLFSLYGMLVSVVCYKVSE